MDLSRILIGFNLEVRTSWAFLGLPGTSWDLLGLPTKPGRRRAGDGGDGKGTGGDGISLDLQTSGWWFNDILSFTAKMLNAWILEDVSVFRLNACAG